MSFESKRRMVLKKVAVAALVCSQPVLFKDSLKDLLDKSEDTGRRTLKFILSSDDSKNLDIYANQRDLKFFSRVREDFSRRGLILHFSDKTESLSQISTIEFKNESAFLQFLDLALNSNHESHRNTKLREDLGIRIQVFVS